MKKLIIVLFTICSAMAASAQVQFGVKAGLNIANLNTSRQTYVDGTSPSSRADINGGVLASVPLFSRFFLQPEFIYSGQGQTINRAMTKATINYDYINLPVLFKYQGASGLFAETGPQIGILISGKEKINGNTFDDNTSQPIDFSWAFGVGYKLQTLPIGIDFRYNLGLTSIYTESQFGTAKNSVFQLDVFYMLGGK